MPKSKGKSRHHQIDATVERDTGTSTTSGDAAPLGMLDPLTAARKREGWLICVLLVGLTWAVFGQINGHEFVNFDDDIYVLNNRHVRTGLSVENIGWAFTTSYGANWFPFSWISLMCDSEFFGVESGAFHRTNLLLHTVNVLLLFLVLPMMTGAYWKSGVVAALFAIHPLHVESVAWVAERKDVLSTLFGFAAIGAYTAYVRHRKTSWYLLALLAYVASLFSKQMLVMLPFLLLVLDYWPLGRSDEPKRRLVLEKLPFLVLTLAFCVVVFLVQRGGGSMSAMADLSLATRIMNAIVVYVLYLRNCFWPVDLSVFYPHPEGGLAMWVVGLSAILLVALMIMAVSQRRRHPYLLSGWLWYLGTLVPVIGIVQVGAQQMADRYTYIPLIGIFIGVTWLVPALVGEVRTRHGLLAVVTGLGLVALAAAAHRQTAYWSDSITLFEHALLVTAPNATTHTNLGTAFDREGRHGESVTNYRKAIALDPNYAGAHNNLGVTLCELGQVDQAIEHHRIALTIDPKRAGARFNLSVALARQGRLEEAIAEYKQALADAPEFYTPHNNLGAALNELGRFDEAASHFREVLRVDPENASVFYNMGIGLAAQGRLEEAEMNYRRALNVNPEFANAHYNLGVTLSDMGRASEALFHFDRAFELDPDNQQTRIGVSSTYVTAGAELANRNQLDAAIEHFRTAIARFQTIGAPISISPLSIPYVGV